MKVSINFIIKGCYLISQYETFTFQTNCKLTMSLFARNLPRLVTSTSRRGLAVSSTTMKDLSMPDPVEHATGKMT